MAQSFDNAVITDLGIKLLNDAQSGESSIVFTRIAVGDGTYLENEKESASLVKMTGMKREIESYAITNKEKTNDSAVVLRTLISNYDDIEKKVLITEGFYINEIAVFAKVEGSEEEIMYSLAVTSGETGDYMPAYNGYNPAQIIQSYLVAINNNAEAKIIVKNEVYALQKDVDALQAKVQNCAKGAGIEFSVVDGILCVTYDDEISTGTEEDENEEITLSYVFDNTIAGNAAGTISLYTEDETAAGDYQLYWSNADGIMDNYSEINTETLTLENGKKLEYTCLAAGNAIPEHATSVTAVKDGISIAICDIPSDKSFSAGNYGERLYSFGAISDVHYQYDTGEDDFKAALEYFEKENVAAVCCAGDLTGSGEVYQMQEVKNAIDTCLSNIPFYSCNGNHECWYYQPSVAWEQICSDGMWHLKEINNDIFIFVNIHGKTASDTLFTDEELSWLEQTLETYRNQRVFLFQHVFPHNLDGFANPGDAYELNLWGTAADRGKFMELMEHYKNVIWFSGHSHIKYSLQESNKNCNYYRYKDGAQLVHLSSLTIPRDITDGVVSDYLYAQSEGTLVDVYQNHIVLRSRNFVDEKFIGIAQYLIDTTPTEIEANENLTTKYYITNNLTYVTSSNSVQYVTENESYTATLTANTGYTLESVTVTMGDEDITSTSYSDGVVTIANVTGAITITAIAVANEDTISCTSITLDSAELTFSEKGETATLTVTVTPLDTTDEVVWTSSNLNIATVSDGIVTSVANGTATITAMCGTQTTTCEVTVDIEDEEGITVLYSLTGTYTLSSKGETIAIAEKNIDTENAGKHVYIKWDKLEYTGDDASAEKVGFLIILKNDSTQLYGAQYADYSNEVDAVGGSANTGVNNISISAKSSSSATATFPATLSVTNLKIYTKD